MLSILIPTYNYNAFFLAQEIHAQLINTAIRFEIICIDDGSSSKLNIENEKINDLSFANFEVLENNIGRSAIRNLLAKKANFEWLLFLDADVLPVKKDFIKQYISSFAEKETVFCGGVSYNNSFEKKELLRFKYGKKHEEIDLNIKHKNPNKYFFTSNFLIPKKIFHSINFDEDLSKYGYEDLLFAKELNKNTIEIKHIDNCVFHNGIDTNQVFCNKTKHAIKNLVAILNAGKLNFNETQLTKTYQKLQKLKLTKLLEIDSFNFEKKAIEKSSLFYFNLFRLQKLHQVFKNSK